MTDNESNETPDPQPRCVRCSNYLVICGHELPFKDRIQSVAIDRTSLTVK